MHGPIRLVRSRGVERLENLGPIYEWKEGKAYLLVDRVLYRGRHGAILTYNNPPVHQVATPGLHAFMDGLDEVIRQSNLLDYLILYDSNDPLHAGGDLKESLRNLERTLETKREKELAGEDRDEIDKLFGWGEERLRKGITLHQKIRTLARSFRVVAVCGGGMRFGGSAEIPLMADVLIGDARGGMCFSEAMIGIIPGWGGITRVLIKSGALNAEYMAKTAREVPAPRLKEIGVYNEVLEVPFPLPAPGKNGLEELDVHNDRTGMVLLPRALECATCPADDLPGRDQNQGEVLATREEIDWEVSRRVDPYRYSRLWNRPLKEIRDEIDGLGRPLAPQSVAAVEALLCTYDPAVFEESRFVEEELRADAALYRDPRFLEGLRAMLEQRVPDFRDRVDRDMDETGPVRLRKSQKA